MEAVYKFLKDNCEKYQNYGLNKEHVTDMWVNGLISNFEYLMYINSISSRSFNDLSAYPIFPWVIFDYHTRDFNLSNPHFFRDLTKPIGAINKHRLQKLKVKKLIFLLLCLFCIIAIILGD